VNLWAVRRRIELLLHTRLTQGALSDKEAAELDELYEEELRLSGQGEASDDGSLETG
jgi:hypothetical protein